MIAPISRYLRFVHTNKQLLLFGLLMTFGSSFGQSFFVGLFQMQLREAFDLTASAFGGAFMLYPVTPTPRRSGWPGAHILENPMSIIQTIRAARTLAAKAISTCLLGLALTAAPTAARALDLNQGAYVNSTTFYDWSHRSIPAIPVVGSPQDADWDRWAMLHDGSVYRLYAFQAGSRDTLYQFGFNRSTNSYEFGYQSIPVLRIVGAPRSASAGQFAMLHDGSVYRLYLQDSQDPRLLHQFGFNRATNDYEYGHNSIPTLRVTGFPKDTDWRRWAMLHDGSVYRFYAFRQGSGTEVYQAGYNAGVQEYQFSHKSIPVLTMRGFPRNSNRNSMAMLHDGADFRFYFTNR